MNKYFEPKLVNDHFVDITKVPHPSGMEDGVRYYVKNWAIDKGYKQVPSISEHIKEKVFFFDDNAPNDPATANNPDSPYPGKRVIVINRPGKNEKAAPVNLQAHMDMVAVPTEDIFPLKLKEDGEWLEAEGTSLGADDGIGVATALAILEDPQLKDYPIQCLFTVQEETNMGGAKYFDVKLLEYPDHPDNRKLINLDAENLKEIIYGSAGGCNTEYKRKIIRMTSSTGYIPVNIEISGLQSGHSGIEINTGRANAIKILAGALVRLNKRITNIEKTGSINSYPLYLESFKRSDNVKQNSIPAAATAVVYVQKDNVDSFKQDLGKYLDCVKAMYQPVEQKFSYSIKDQESANLLDPMDARSTDTILCMLQQLPHGIIKMLDNDENPNIVETSTNLCDVQTDATTVIINSSNRSSNSTSLEKLNSIQKEIGELFSFTVETGKNSYPSWQPNSQSKCLQIAEAVYKEQYGDSYDATVIHAGLECGFIVKRCPGMDCISIGPTIENPHTTSERLHIKDSDSRQLVALFYDTVSKIIRKIFADNNQ